MVQSQIVIIEIARRFSKAVKSEFPVNAVLLFGSYAKGTATAESDIDVGIVVDVSDHKKRFEITASLMHLAFRIDPRIEPKCIFSDEYNNPEQASILSEIIQSSIKVN